MAEETKGSSPASPLTLAETSSSPKGPLIMMKGGTSSSSEDLKYQAFMEDTRRRWAERDNEKAQAAQGLPDGHVAEKSHDLGQPGTSLVAVIGYYRPETDEYQYMQADVVMQVDTNGQPDETFVFVCPRCVDRGRAQTYSQCSVRRSHRRWHLDTRCRGDFFADDDGSVYSLVGKIICDEKIRCSAFNCDGVYQIGEYPAGKEGRRGTTGMWRV